MVSQSLSMAEPVLLGGSDRHAVNGVSFGDSPGVGHPLAIVQPAQRLGNPA